MQVMKRGFAFYVFANIHVAVAAYCLTKISFLVYDINNQTFANFVFFATILSYNLIRFAQMEKIQSMVSIWIRANKKYLVILNVVALLGSIFYLISFSFEEILQMIPFVIATLLYVFPHKKKNLGLRTIPGLKLFIISITWAGLTLYLPLFSYDLINSEAGYISLVQRFLFILAITIPFDIRDAQFDLPGLHTLPQQLGVSNSKIIAVLALFTVVLLDTMIPYTHPGFFRINLFIMVLSVIMITFSGTKRGRYYTAFWIESLPILWYLLYLSFI